MDHCKVLDAIINKMRRPAYVMGMMNTEFYKESAPFNCFIGKCIADTLGLQNEIELVKFMRFYTVHLCHMGGLMMYEQIATYEDVTRGPQNCLYLATSLLGDVSSRYFILYQEDIDKMVGM